MLYEKYRLCRGDTCILVRHKNVYSVQIKRQSNNTQIVFGDFFYSYNVASEEYEIVSDILAAMEALDVKETQVLLPLKHFALDDTEFSHGFRLYSLLPKWVQDKRAKKVPDGVALEPIDRVFTLGGDAYNVIVKPTQIKRNGKWESVLPGSKENHVEMALFKLACAPGNAVMIGNQVAVSFTLRELRRELEAHKRTVSHRQLTESLDILTSCQMQLFKYDKTRKRVEIFKENLFTSSLESHQSDEHGKAAPDDDSKMLIVFNSLVKADILANDFKRYNYQICMSYSSYVAAYLHMRLSFRFLQADALSEYKINLTTILEGTGKKRHKYLSKNLEKIRLALDEMIDKGVLKSHSEKKIKNRAGQEDYEITLVPSESFCMEIKASNAFAYRRGLKRNTAPAVPTAKAEKVEQAGPPASQGRLVD